MIGETLSVTTRRPSAARAATSPMRGDARVMLATAEHPVAAISMRRRGNEEAVEPSEDLPVHGLHVDRRVAAIKADARTRKLSYYFIRFASLNEARYRPA